MAKFRKKPVNIEAVQIDLETSKLTEYPNWIKDAVRTGELVQKDSGVWKVVTLEDGDDGEAQHIATPGDWVIKGVEGELYFCKPAIFDKTYEPVKEIRKVSEYWNWKPADK